MYCTGQCYCCCFPLHADGRGFYLLGAVMWAPLCGTVHWANSKLDATAAVQAWLAKHDLLDLQQPSHQQQQQVLQAQELQQQQQQQIQQQEELQQQQPKVPIRYEDMPWREKIIAVEAVKQREMAELHSKMREDHQAVLAAALNERRQQQEQESKGQQQGQRRRWLLF